MAAESAGGLRGESGAGHILPRLGRGAPHLREGIIQHIILLLTVLDVASSQQLLAHLDLLQMTEVQEQKWEEQEE